MTQQSIPDGRLVAVQNEQAVLHWLHRFGGLTTRQLARLVWPGKSAGQRMAQRTIGRLETQGLVLKRSLFTGGKIYVISERGARLLREMGTQNVSSRGHRDLSFHKPTHRMIANDFLIDWLNNEIVKETPDHRIWTEFEVQHRLAPYPDISIGGKLKIPDGMIQQDDYLIWIEVENSYKGPREIGRLMSTARLLLENKDQSYLFKKDGTYYRIYRFFFILPNDQRVSAITNAIYQSDLSFDALNYVELWRVEISSGLVWRGIRGSITASQVKDLMIKKHSKP